MSLTIQIEVILLFIGFLASIATGLIIIHKLINRFTKLEESYKNIISGNKYTMKGILTCLHALKSSGVNNGVSKALEDLHAYLTENRDL